MSSWREGQHFGFNWLRATWFTSWSCDRDMLSVAALKFEQITNMWSWSESGQSFRSPQMCAGESCIPLMTRWQKREIWATKEACLHRFLWRLHTLLSAAPLLPGMNPDRFVCQDATPHPWLSQPHHTPWISSSSHSLSSPSLSAPSSPSPASPSAPSSPSPGAASLSSSAPSPPDPLQWLSCRPCSREGGGQLVFRWGLLAES